MKSFSSRLALVALAAAADLGVLHGAELQPAAFGAWQAYLRTADMRVEEHLVTTGRFLWIDEVPGRDLSLRNGAILVAPGMGTGTLAVPNGLIHHWIAAAFIPHANLASVLRVAHDYANYKQFYHPDIIDSKVLASTDVVQSFSMRSLHRVLFVTAVMDSQFAAHDFQVDAKRWYIVADATRVQEVENFGRPNERVLPPDRGKGYVWRLHTITRYEERNGGVYVEMEAIALSREIPAAPRWLVDPAVAHFSRSELMSSLRQTREAVTTTIHPEQRVNYSVADNSPGGRAGDDQQ